LPYHDPVAGAGLPGSSVGAFGDKFREERDRQHISLDDVARVTKISPRMLQAIEEERFSQLPGGVFNKGFIRAYAKHLGLDGEEAVNDYLACMRQAQIDASVALASSETSGGLPAQPNTSHRAKTAQEEAEELSDLQLPRAEDVVRRRPAFLSSRPGFPWRAVVAIVVLVFAVGAFWARRTHSAPAPESTSQPPASSPNPATSPSSVSTPSAAASNGSLPSPSASLPQPAALSGVSSANAPAADATILASKQTPVPEDDDATPVPAHKSAAATATSAPKLTLVIRAAETSWISVTADGQPISHETLIAPAHTSVRANREIVVKAGNAAGVTFLWNGKEIPAQGAESEVKTLVFDVEGMRVVPPGQPPDQTR
jgi:cytoskeleton protein RodZ